MRKKGCRYKILVKKSSGENIFYLSFNSSSFVLYMFIIEMENREKYEVKQERVRMGQVRWGGEGDKGDFFKAEL